MMTYNFETVYIEEAGEIRSHRNIRYKSYLEKKYLFSFLKKRR